MRTGNKGVKGGTTRTKSNPTVITHDTTGTFGAPVGKEMPSMTNVKCRSTTYYKRVREK